jgi:uncharacterized FAD-dependent dehydrogenase
MKKMKVVFIGAGVSNLTAANNLIDNSFDDFIIIEKGQILSKRVCTGADNYTCNFCDKGCSTAEGVGGANALNGNKLCYFPASSGIIDNTKTNGIELAFNYLRSLMSNYIDPTLNSKEHFFEHKKNYNSDVLNKKDFSAMINLLTKKLQNHIIANCPVLSIRNCGTKILIVTNNGDEYLADKLVLGSGRSSHIFLKDYLKNNGLPYSVQTQDIGIRIETFKNNFNENYYYQVDPKLKFTFNQFGSGRTFCAHNQGKVVPVRFGNSFFADGAFGESFGNKNNIALMVRGNNPLSSEQLETWCNAINILSSGQLIIGEVKIKNDRKLMISEIMELICHYPTFEHKVLINELLKKILIGEYNILHSNIENEKLRIYGPAIDRYWVKPLLNNDFSVFGTNNIYVIGDAAGLSRGFIQAMYSGYIWADVFFKNSANPQTNKKELIWSNLA